MCLILYKSVYISIIKSVIMCMFYTFCIQWNTKNITVNPQSCMRTYMYTC